MASLLHSLSLLSAARDDLHSSLRAAGFQLSTTRREEERRGRLVGIEAVPTDPDTLVPLYSTERAAGDNGGGWRLVALNTNTNTTSSSSSGKKNSNDNDEDDDDDDDGKSAVAGSVPATAVDPLLCFSGAPSQELRETQRLYRTVLKCAVAAVNAQEVAVLQALTQEGNRCHP